MAVDRGSRPGAWRQTLQIRRFRGIICLDWGHATLQPLYGNDHATMGEWYRSLAPHIGMIHLQQTDFQFDRHWDFTEMGAVIPKEAASQQREFGLGDRPIFLEVFYPFERDDASILQALSHSTAILKPAFADTTIERIHFRRTTLKPCRR